MELESAQQLWAQVSAVSSKSNQSYMSQQFANLKTVKSIYIYKRYLLTSLVGAGVGGSVG